MIRYDTFLLFFNDSMLVVNTLNTFSALDEDESFSKEHLRNHRTLFLEELEPTKTADYLFQFYVFSIATHDEIEKESSRLNKARLVLYHLSEKSPKCLDTFGEVLKLSKQNFIIRTLYEQEGRNSLTPKGKSQCC